MLVTDLIVEVRDSTLARVGQIRPVDLVDFTAVLRFQEVGTWSIPIRASNPLADALRAPGAGIIVNGPGFSFSGPTSSAKLLQSQTDPVGTWEISGLTDDVILGERVAYPTPSTSDLSLQVDEFDTRTGVASTVIIGYVNANIGPSAPTARKIASLSLAADPNVGSTITGNAKFDSLGSLVKKLASIDALGFTIRQVDSGLEFLVYEPVDRSSTIRMDVDNNLLSKSEYTYSAPTATRVIVAGSGSGTSRVLEEVTTTTASAAEAAWGRRIELFKDDRANSSSEALTQTGETELADKGKTLEAISVTPTDDTTMEYGLDWNLGDKVSVVVGSETISQIVTEVGIKVSEDGIRVGATVGLPAVADEESAVVETQTDQESRISNLERNTTDTSGGGGGGGSHGSHPVAWEDITDVPSSFTPSAHAATHASDGSDPVTLAQSQVTNLTTDLAGKASTSHTHAIADVTGLQTALDSKVVATSEDVSSGIISSATGWGSSTATYLERNGVVQVNLRATRTGASLSSGNITNVLVQTISAGYRPALETLAGGGPTGPVIGAYINTSGGVYLTALGSGIATGDSIDINATYIKA